MKTKTCPKCGGSGRIDSCSHVMGGRCFRCGGSGVVEHTAQKQEFAMVINGRVVCWAKGFDKDEAEKKMLKGKSASQYEIKTKKEVNKAMKDKKKVLGRELTQKDVDTLFA